MANLQVGSSGSAVTTLQSNLLRLGFELPRYGADGQYGTETAQAVRDFQYTMGLTIDGIYGPQSATSLTEALGLLAKGQWNPTIDPLKAPTVSYAKPAVSTTPAEVPSEARYIPIYQAQQKGAPAVEVTSSGEVIEAPQWVKDWVQQYDPSQFGYKWDANSNVWVKRAGILEGLGLGNIDWKWVGIGLLGVFVAMQVFFPASGPTLLAPAPARRRRRSRGRSRRRSYSYARRRPRSRVRRRRRY